VVIGPFAALLILLVGLAILVKRVSQRRAPHQRRRGPGPGAAGAVYELLNEDRRKALEIIVEQRAEVTDPETADDVPEGRGRGTEGA
jgi:hypothetical protein